MDLLQCRRNETGLFVEFPHGCLYNILTLFEAACYALPESREAQVRIGDSSQQQILPIRITTSNGVHQD